MSWSSLVDARLAPASGKPSPGQLAIQHLHQPREFLVPVGGYKQGDSQGGIGKKDPLGSQGPLGGGFLVSAPEFMAMVGI